MNRFPTELRPLSPHRPELGSVALLPWDSETFGFAVGEVTPGPVDTWWRESESVAQRLQTWSAEENVELVSCSVPASEPRWAAVLAALGFRFVEMQLRALLPRIREHELAAGELRAASPEDRPALLRLAGEAFTQGRYFNDARVPRPLAARRFQHWIERALRSADAGERVFVLDDCAGFFHLSVDEGRASLRLGAIDPAHQGGPSGHRLWSAALRAAARMGARSASAVVSAANTPALNLYSALGFSLRDPRLVYHWHAAVAPHLLEGP